MNNTRDSTGMKDNRTQANKPYWSHIIPNYRTDIVLAPSSIFLPVPSIQPSHLFNIIFQIPCFPTDDLCPGLFLMSSPGPAPQVPFWIPPAYSITSATSILAPLLPQSLHSGTFFPLTWAQAWWHLCPPTSSTPSHPLDFVRQRELLAQAQTQDHGRRISKGMPTACGLCQLPCVNKCWFRQGREWWQG